MTSTKWIAMRFGLVGWLVACLVLLSACSNPPRPSRRNAPSTQTGQTRSDSVAARPTLQSITWSTPLGPGGAELPSWPLLKTPEEASIGFSRLIGVVLPQDRAELLFVGVDNPALPKLSVDDLTDAFVIALRALPGAPGVSIDPTPEQLRRGLREGDEMTVRYVGGDERSVVGLTAFEADRLMKSLSFGKDNLTRQPFSSAVPGYRSELDAILASPDEGDKEWHRFWIEQAENLVEVSDDGRALRLGARLQVRTDYRQVRGGVLVAGNRPPSGPAREFSEHLTAHYDAYARELRAYHELQAYAQVVALAGALVDPNADRRIHDAADRLDLDRLIARANVRALDTPAATPAIVVSKTADRGAQRLQVFLTGGVDLTPRLRYRSGSPPVNALQRAVLASAERNVTRATWSVPGPDGPLVVARRPLTPTDTRLWQTDMMVGLVRFVRVSASSADGSIGRQWKPMLPELQFSSDIVELQEGGRSPRFATVTTLDGTRAVLGQPATLQMPGQPSTSGFLPTGSARQRRRALYRFKNVIVLEDGDVKYVRINGGPPQPQFEGGAMAVEFAATAPYRAERLRNSDGVITFLWEGARLAGYRAESGEQITLRYDNQGRIIGLDGTDGQRVDYRLDGKDNLIAAANGTGDSVSYLVSQSDGKITGISAAFTNMPTSGEVDFAMLAVSSGMSLGQIQEATRQHSSQGAVFIGLTNAPAGTNREVDVVIAGQTIGLLGSLQRALEAVLDERGSGPRSNWLRDTFLGHEAARGRSNVIVVGDPYIRNQLARGLSAVAPELTVSTASNPQRAAQNLRALQRGRRGFKHVHVANGLDPSINAGVEPLAAASGDGDLLIVSGHNSIELQSVVNGLGGEGSLKGKSVLLVTCGESGGNYDALLGGGATQVLAFSDPINARVLPPLTKAIHAGLARTNQPATLAIRRVVQEAIRELLRQNIEGVPKGDLLVLESQLRQIGRRGEDDREADIARHEGARITRRQS